MLTAFLSGSRASADNASALAILRQKLAEKQANQAALSGKVKDAAAQLKVTQAQLVGAAAAVQRNEQAMQALDAQTAQAVADQAAEQKELHADTASMGDLVLALTRLRRTPPELMIVRPGAPLATAESARLLGAVLPTLNQRTAEIANAIRRLAATQRALAADRAKALATKASLGAEYKRVSDLAAQRGALYRQLNGNLSQTQDEAAKISKQAQSLQDLIDRLARARAAATASTEAAAKTGQKPTHYAYSWSMPKPGRPELPVAGRILTGFGEKDRIGATSQGITLAAQPGALAVAPMGGIVRYAGPFRDYGHLVLLEHDDGYISLIAGLDTITASLGQSLQAGEPLGKLPAGPSRAAAPALYYELRYRGQPINPAVKFPDLRVKS